MQLASLRTVGVVSAAVSLPAVIYLLAIQLASLRAMTFVSVAVIAPAFVTQAARVQLPGLTIPSDATADRASVVQIFNKSYNAYRCGRDI
jgi:hypothetical protein